MAEAEVSAVMLRTRLHGAHWTWFGGRSLGENRYRDCSTVVIMGREELPVGALEDQARALFGDTEGETLAFVASDANDRRFLPETEVPYVMADGSARGARVRLHPDPRVRALQRQSRECATRQLVERLRLAHASFPKRVILGSSLPVPGLPVTQLVAFEDLVPPRLAQACAEAFVDGRPLRLSAPGLHTDAPCTFPSVEAAKSFLKRNVGADWPTPSSDGNVLRVHLRCAETGARGVDALVPADDAGAARAIAEAAYGPLASFRVLTTPG